MKDNYRKKDDFKVVTHDWCSHCNQLQPEVESRVRRYAWMYNADKRAMVSCKPCFDKDYEAADQHYYQHYQY